MGRRIQNIRKKILRSILPALRILPPRTVSRLVTAFGRTEYALVSSVRVRVDAAAARGEAHFGRNWDQAGLSRALAGNLIHWRSRDLLLDGRPNRRVAPLFSVRGREWVDAVLGAGKGMVLLCNHFGSHMMPAHWLLREDYPLRLFMERPNHISKFLSRRFDSEGPTGQRKLFISRKAAPAESAAAVMRAVRVVRENMILMIAGDVRWSGVHTSPATFLGRRYTFSNTWVALAALTGAPIVRVFSRIGADGTYLLDFLEPFTVPRGSLGPEEITAQVQSYLRTVEEWVERDPANSADYFFWEGSPEPTAATGLVETP